MIPFYITLSFVICGHLVKSDSYSQPEYFAKIGQGAEKNYLLDDHGKTTFSLIYLVFNCYFCFIKYSYQDQNTFGPFPMLESNINS